MVLPGRKVPGPRYPRNPWPESAEEDHGLHGRIDLVALVFSRLGNSCVSMPWDFQKHPLACCLSSSRHYWFGKSCRLVELTKSSVILAVTWYPGPIATPYGRNKSRISNPKWRLLPANSLKNQAFRGNKRVNFDGFSSQDPYESIEH